MKTVEQWFGFLWDFMDEYPSADEETYALLRADRLAVAEAVREACIVAAQPYGGTGIPPAIRRIDIEEIVKGADDVE